MKHIKTIEEAKELPFTDKHWTCQTWLSLHGIDSDDVIAFIDKDGSLRYVIQVDGVMYKSDNP